MGAKRTGAKTRPGEFWHHDSRSMTDVLVDRGGQPLRIATFRTVLDAAAAIQAHNILVHLKAGRRDVDTLLKEYGL